MTASVSGLTTAMAWLLLLLLLETQRRCLGADTSSLQWKETVEADVVIEGYILTVPAVSILHCAHHCSAVNACLSFGHSRGQWQCWLYPRLLEFSSNGASSPGTRYFTPLLRDCPPLYRQRWGICYRAVSTPANWTQARSTCQAEGGRLFSADTSTKFRLLTTLPHTFAYWIGGTDSHKEGEWRWLSGRLATDHWDAGEPNDYADEDCAYLRDVVTLRTRNCSLAYPYVCEIQM